MFYFMRMCEKSGLATLSVVRKADSTLVARWSQVSCDNQLEMLIF